MLFFDLDDEVVSSTIKPGSTLMAARRIINILNIDFSIIISDIYIIFEYSWQVCVSQHCHFFHYNL